MMQSIGKLCLLLGLLGVNTVVGAEMSDHKEIETTIYNYFNGLKEADRGMLERAFVKDGGHMKGFLRKEDGAKELTVRPMSEVIDEWAAREPNPDLKGSILSLQIYSNVAATVLFDFNGVFVDSFQLAKTKAGWRIVNKYYIDQ
ncbi:MAG: nuclear transport factor 2 family protein [Pseudomonadota bacterium]|nr:nuclear transport factor 2 family protein [Pseudomonadota bacterium]